jgi:hypothetical protein
MNNSKQNSQPPATKATSPLEKKFREGVKLIMEHWPALSIAVENGWASKYKRKYANDLPRNERFKTDEEYRAQFVDEICKFVLGTTFIKFSLISN